MNFAVVIPSKTESNLIPCVEAVREHQPLCRIVIVDDGIELDHILWREWGTCTVIEGSKPFVFSRNINIGIVESFSWDQYQGVVLLNDDALLKTPGGFYRLAELADQHEDIGIIAPVTNVTGQPLQMPKGIGLRKVPHIAFVCVYIPRRTIERIGMLDERYKIDYGVEDLDYCEAVNRAGLKVCVYDHVFVDHGSLRSSFRGDPKTPRPFTKNYELYKKKWSIT